MDFLCALDRPIFEDVVATCRGVSLAGGLVAPPALGGARDNAGEAAERVHGARAPKYNFDENRWYCYAQVRWVNGEDRGYRGARHVGKGERRYDQAADSHRSRSD
jgi:hypothetical protein